MIYVRKGIQNRYIITLTGDEILIIYTNKDKVIKYNFDTIYHSSLNSKIKVTDVPNFILQKIIKIIFKEK